MLAYRIVAFALPVVLGAQSIEPVHLGPALIRFEGDLRTRPLDRNLEAPRSIKELSNGRVLILDELRLLTATPDRPRLTPLGGEPVGKLIGLSLDSSFVYSTKGWRFLNDTASVGALPPTNRVVAALKRNGEPMEPEAAAHQFVYYAQWALTEAESTSLRKINRVTGEITVLARLWPGRAPVPGILRPPCGVYEHYAVAPDGFVAIVRANPYRVDWVDDAGTLHKGSPIPTAKLAFSQKERAVYQAWRAAEPYASLADTTTWPSTVCEFVGGYWPIMTQDKLLVYRVPTTRAPATRYDVVNRKGEVEYQLALAANESVLGFGQSSVYVITTDGKTQRLSKHAWPPPAVAPNRR